MLVLEFTWAQCGFSALPSLPQSQGPSTSSLEPVNKVSSIDELIRGLEGQANQNAQPSPHHVSFVSNLDLCTFNICSCLIASFFFSTISFQAKSSHNTNGQACNNSEDVMTNMVGHSIVYRICLIVPEVCVKGSLY